MGELDYVLEIKTANKRNTFIVEVKRIGQPKWAREAVNSILRYLSFYTNAKGLFIAPFISPKSAEICKEAGVNYLDFAGNCSIQFENVYIRVDGQENPFRNERSLRSMFAPKASRVLRVLLSNPIETVWKIKKLSREAEVSIGHVSNVKSLLEEREWITERNIGFSVRDPREILAAWSENYTYRKNKVREFYSLDDLSEIEQKASSVCESYSSKWALTGFSGAGRIAPSVRYQRSMIFIQDHVEEVVEALDLKDVGSGGNVMILDPFDEGVFYGSTMIDGIRVVTPVQLYLDLVGFRGRGEEAAEAVLRQVIEPQWL